MISQINVESKENGATPVRNVEDDLFIEDIELGNMETPSTFLDSNFSLSSSAKVNTVVEGNKLNLENSKKNLCKNKKLKWVNLEKRITENQKNDIQWLQGIMKTLNKYLKNSLISLMIVTSMIPLNLPTLYAFVFNVKCGCENSTLTALTEFSYFVWFSLYTLFPILIKFKLDRLSQ